MKILLISQSFMSPKIGYKESNFGGAEAFINNFCIAYHKNHSISVIATADATCSLPGVNLLKCDNFSRAYLEEQSGEKARCNNGGIVKVINSLDLSEFDLIVDNSCNRTIYSRLNAKLRELSSTVEKVPQTLSIAHSRPSYAGMGVEDSVKNMYENTYVKFISVTESATDEWNKLAEKVVGKRFFAGAFGLKILDKPELVTMFNYERPSGVIVGRIDPVKNFGQFNNIARNNQWMRFDAFTMLLPCGQKTYDQLRIDRLPDNINYRMNVPVHEKEAYIFETGPITFSTSVSENGGTTCLEAMMMGLPICVVGHKENGCTKYVTDGEVVDVDKSFIITKHGIVLNREGNVPAAFESAMKRVMEIKPFDSKVIREYFLENYSFNEKSLNHLMKL